MKHQQSKKLDHAYLEHNPNKELEGLIYQRKIEEIKTIVDNRELVRPKTSAKNIIACLAGLVVGLFGFGLLFVLLPIDFTLKVILYVAINIIFLEFYLRFFGIELIKAYQHYGDPEIRGRCACVPSCSEYSIAVLKKYPLIIALSKIHKRLFKTCDGEYKIDNP